MVVNLIESVQLYITTKVSTPFQTRLTARFNPIESMIGTNSIKLMFTMCHNITDIRYWFTLGNRPASLTNCILLVLIVERIVNMVRKNPINVPLMFRLLSTVDFTIESSRQTLGMRRIKIAVDIIAIVTGQYFSIRAFNLVSS